MYVRHPAVVEWGVRHPAGVEWGVRYPAGVEWGELGLVSDG